MNKRHQWWQATWLRVVGVIVLCFVSALFGSLMTRHFGNSNYNISYADFISVMLSCVSVLMTVLALVLAVFGVIGWTSIRERTHAKTTDFLNEGFREGNFLHTMIRAEVREAIFAGVDPIPEQANDEENGAGCNE